jgi:hypothetical protein
MKIRLSIAVGSEISTSFEHSGPVIRIGCGADCELSLPEEVADSVARQHARIGLVPGQASFTDVSRDGSLLNDTLVTGTVPLQVGDRIQLGYKGPMLTVLELDLVRRPPVRNQTLVPPTIQVELVPIPPSPGVPKLRPIPVLAALAGVAGAVGIAIGAVVLSLFLWRQANVAPQPSADQGKQASQLPPAQDTEALARGPVHEAYAQPVDYSPQPGPLVAAKPPDPIEELPPDQKPDGVDVEWIPGYWDWDDEGKEYLWISGLWRDAPPGSHWLPGAWQEVEGGYMWSPGIWISEETQEIAYVPDPPPSVDTDPPTAPPNRNAVYAPGSWLWSGDRWAWRPGFWVTPVRGMVWVPARYVWTPAGSVFLEGHWDYPLEGRGLLFSPVRISRRNVADWTYVPRYVVGGDFMLSALFVGPGRQHYYFGDYFTPVSRVQGFQPWMDYRPTNFSYDPLYAHYRMLYRDAPDWETNLRELYRARFAGEIPRPPRTLMEQRQMIETITANKTANGTVIRNVTITSQDSVTALTRVTEVRGTDVTRLAGLAPEAVATRAYTITTRDVSKEDRAGEKPQIRHFQETTQVRSAHEARLLEAGTTHLNPAGSRKSAPLVVPKSPVVRPARVIKPPPPPTPKSVDRIPPPFVPPKPPTPPRRR